MSVFIPVGDFGELLKKTKYPYPRCPECNVHHYVCERCGFTLMCKCMEAKHFLTCDDIFVTETETEGVKGEK